MPKTFEFQDQLPSLSIPPLEQTLEKYLTTVQPFLDPEDFEKTVALTMDFKANKGPVLQKRLEERVRKCSDLFGNQAWCPVYVDDNEDKSDVNSENANLTEIEPTKNNWLIDWWNQYSYLRYREPVVLNVSFFFIFPINFGSMISRAAQISYCAVKFKDMILKQELDPDMLRDKPMCMEQYKFLFNTCRVPKLLSDDVRMFNPNKNHHIVVIRNNLFYYFSLVDDEGKLLDIEEIEKNFLWIVNNADHKAKAPNIGAFTADHRDKWAKTYKLLEKDNAEFLRIVESSSFVICLDSATPITREEMAHLCWHGHGYNRWFDKSLQFIVFQNGRAGFLGEHSMMDATTPATLCDYICENSNNNKKLSEQVVKQFESLKNPPKNLLPKLNESLLGKIDHVLLGLTKEIANHDVQCLNYTKYGKGFIKSQSVSPDSYIQMAIQLAYFRLMGTFVATYESAGMRRYQWGRTETCRSVSLESVEFCKAMEDFTMSKIDKRQLGKIAIQNHSSYMAGCLQGNGIDRHFLGLRLCLQKNEPMPAFFLDPVYNLSCHWTLSTSQIPTNYFEGYGWGEVVPDGFGVAYMVREDRIMLNVAGLVGPAVPDLDDHLSHEVVVDTSHIPTEGLREMNQTPDGKKRRDVHQSYFADNYKKMRVKWFRTCLEDAFDDMHDLFANTKEDGDEQKTKSSRSQTPKSSTGAISENLRMTTSVIPSPSLTSLPSTSSLGLSLAYPNRQVYPEGVVGEDVGLIEFEIGWSEQRKQNPSDASSSYSRRKKLVKMFQWWGEDNN